MATTTSISNPAQMIITLEDNALVADIKRALKLIRGVASVRVTTISDDNTITPAMRRSINTRATLLAAGAVLLVVGAVGASVQWLWSVAQML
ncbi:MAG: hypothetical protein IJ570_04955 [Prevotella sp.]|nr:hypothetical protein [Bacteroidaceae bacterium]MBR1415195.1 hypothetical protein [Prevotella sp.]